MAAFHGRSAQLTRSISRNIEVIAIKAVDTERSITVTQLTPFYEAGTNFAHIISSIKYIRGSTCGTVCLINAGTAAKRTNLAFPRVGCGFEVSTLTHIAEHIC